MSKQRLLLTTVLVALLAVGLTGLAHRGGHPPGDPGDRPNSGYGPTSPIVGASCGMTQDGGGRMGGMRGGPSGFQLGCGFDPGFVAQSASEAAQAATGFLEETFWAGQSLQARRVMAFSNHYVVFVEEAEKGYGAMALLVDRVTGVVSPEPGSNMMWNGRYDMRGGGMHGGSAIDPEAMSVTSAEARAAAQRFARQFAPEAQISSVTPFYGHYAVTVDQNGQRLMLSVDGETGQVWYHSWHGRFEGAQTL